MQGRARRVGVAVALAAVVTLGSACSSTPNAVGPCHYVFTYQNDGGYIAGFDWDNDVHAYGESAPLTFCIGGAGADTATFQELPGVIVDPTQQPIELGTLTVVTFDVTVENGGQGRLLFSLRTTGGDLFSEAGGPVVTPSGDGWRFTDPDQS